LESFKTHIYKDRPEAPGDTAPQTGGASPLIAFSEKLPTFKEAEHLLLDEALKRAGGNQSIAAQMLGITRSGLNKKINHP
jgi:DNA-binding NtrC family response regulator